MAELLPQKVKLVTIMCFDVAHYSYTLSAEAKMVLQTFEMFEVPFYDLRPAKGSTSLHICIV